MIKTNFVFEGLILLVIIIFLQFFSFTIIPDDSTFLSTTIFGLGLMMLLITLTTILFKNGLTLYSLDQFLIFFLFSIFLSILTAYAFWDQPFIASILSYRLFYIYFLYFVLVYLEFSRIETERILIVLFSLTLIIFIINYKTFPDSLFSLRSEERRNGITIFFYGQGFTFLGAFYFLNKFFKNFKPIDFSLFLLASVFLFFLTQSRMILAGLILGFFLLLFLSKIKYKIVWSALLLIIAVSVYLATDVFKGIKEENSEQARFYTEDVRVNAQEFFLFNLQGGWPTVLFGNGYPAKGSKLEQITYYGQDNGFYTSDVGLTGIFSFFGILGIIAWLYFFYIAFFTKFDEEFNYVKAYFLSVFVTAVTGYSIFDPGYMPATVMALYLIRCNKVKNI